MTEYIICVDGGTTNTRLVLMKNGIECDRVKMGVGAGSVAKNGDNSLLKEQFRIHLDMLLKNNGLSETEIKCIVLSGMICSELGLYCVEHITAPAAVEQLKYGCKKVMLEDVSAVPMVFIPGVKMLSDNLCEMDIMRGEETELAGIRELCGLKESFVLMLPGTHNKIIFADKNGTITSFFTAMSGELTKCVADNTILKEALEGGFTKSADEKMLLSGYDTAEEYGVTSALFKIRILSKFGNFSKEQHYSFLGGVILHEDVRLALKKAGDSKIILGGSEPFRSALKCIFDKRTMLESEILSDEISDKCVSVGALLTIENM